MGNMILSAFTDEYAPAFSRQVEGAKAFSLDAIEIRGADGVNVGNMTLNQIRTYAEKLRDAGIGVSAVGSPLGKISLDGDLEGHMEMTRKICEFANILDTPNVRMFSFYGGKDTPITHCKQQVVDNLGRMLDIANAAGVTLCHENEARIYGDTPERCLELLEIFRGELKCVFDMGNFVLGHVNPWDAYLQLKPYICYFHIKDALEAGAVVPPGKGEAQIQRILQDYTKDHTGVVVTLEPHLQTFQGLNALVENKGFVNPYQYPDSETAFADAVTKLKELIFQ